MPRPDPVERLLQTRLWYRLSPGQQAAFLKHPSIWPRLYKMWKRLSQRRQQEFRLRAKNWDTDPANEHRISGKQHDQN